MYQDVREAVGEPDNVWSSWARHGVSTEAREAGAPIDHLQKSDVEGTRRDYIVGNVETTWRVARKRVALPAEGRGQWLRLLTYPSNFKGKEGTVKSLASELRRFESFTTTVKQNPTYKVNSNADRRALSRRATACGMKKCRIRAPPLCLFSKAFRMPRRGSQQSQ